MNIFIHFIDIIILLIISLMIFALIFNRKYKLALACFVIFAVLCICSSGMAKAVEVKHLNKQNIGKFTAKEFYWWSNRTMEYFTGKSKLKIDDFAKVVKYDLNKGFVLIYSKLPEIVSVIDVFGGDWKKVKIVKGYNLINFSGVKEYAGLKVLVISSPWGFAILKQQSDSLGFKDVAYVILKSELAEFTWQRVAIALALFLISFGLSYYLKREKLIISFGTHLMILLFIDILILSALCVTGHYDIVKLNHTIKKVPHLIFSGEHAKDMWNWLFAVVFSFGYLFGFKFASYRKLYLALVGYSKPIQLHILPYLPDKQLIRDIDGKLTAIKFKNNLQQYITFNLNGYDVKGILAVDTKDMVKSLPDRRFNTAVGLTAFFGFLGLSIAGDYLNVFRIDLPYSLLFAVIIALITNLSTVKQKLGLEIEKEKIIECSQLVNEDNYAKMLKEAEIKHVIEDYERLLRDYVKEKITMPRRTVKHLLSMVRQVRVTKVEEKSKRREGNVEDKD